MRKEKGTMVALSYQTMIYLNRVKSKLYAQNPNSRRIISNDAAIFIALKKFVEAGK